MKLVTWLLWMLPLAALPAQQEATTLAALTKTADSIVVATAVAATDPSPEFHRIEFRTERSLKGNLTGGFAVLEPAGRCCGRALSTIAIGDRVLTFLQQRGGTVHPVGGDRGVMLATDALVDHVLALRNATTQAQHAARIAEALASTEPRIQADAALTLAQLPVTPLDANAQAQILVALDRELQAGSARIPALVTASVRFLGDQAAAPLVRAYCQTEAEDCALALGRGLLQLSATAVHQALAAQPLVETSAQQRACELASAKPDPMSIPMLTQLLAGQPRVSLAAAEALLATGVAPASLAPRTEPVVLDTALQRRATKPRLRAVNLGGAK